MQVQTTANLGDRLSQAVASSALVRRFTDDEVESLYGMGQALLQAGQVDKALSMHFVCTIYRPFSGKYLVGLGKCHREAGNEHAAFQTFAAASTLEPMNFRAALQMGESLMRMHRVDDARRIFESIVDCAKDTKEALPAAARATALLGLMDQA
jgi:Flp pilus assembly protein TadD